MAPKGSSLKRPLRAISRPGPGRDLVGGDPLVGAGRAVEEIHLAVLERLLADRDAERRADQVGVGELLARAAVAVVQEDVGAPVLQLVGEALAERHRLGPRGLDHDDLDAVRRELRRPGHARLPVALLDRRGHDSARARSRSCP